MNHRPLVGSVAAITLTFATSASAATILNLTTAEFDGVAPADSGVVNDALFQVTFQQPTGTGVIDPFLRVQSNDAVTSGMNTNANNVLDNKNGPWTHDLKLSQLANNNGYYRFLLDINEPSSNPLIALERLVISTAATGGLTVSGSAVLPLGASLRYDLDGAGDATVLLDYSRNHGSGSGDLFIDVPTGLFAGADPQSFIYLYASFNKEPDIAGLNLGRHVESGGFEEFAALLGAGSTPVPEPGSALAGMLVLSLAGARFGMRSRPHA